MNNNQEGGAATLSPAEFVMYKNNNGIMSGGYKVNNSLLENTLQLQSGGGKNKKSQNEMIEDLIVPSGFYYFPSNQKNKILHYLQPEDDKDVISESLYDKLLSIVNPHEKKHYSHKTQKISKNEKKIDSIKKTNKSRKIKIKVQ